MQNRLLFGPAVTHRSVQDLLADVRQLLEKDWLELREHERGLARREVDLAERAGALAERQREVETALQELAAQRSELQLLQSAVAESRQGLASFEEEARRQQLALEARLNALAEREARLLPREAALVEREQMLARREEEVGRLLAQNEVSRFRPNAEAAGTTVVAGTGAGKPAESDGATAILTTNPDAQGERNDVHRGEAPSGGPAVLRAERPLDRRAYLREGGRGTFPGMLIAGAAHPAPARPEQLEGLDA